MKNQKASATTTQDLVDDLKSLVTEAQAAMSGSVSEHSSEALRQIRARFDAAQLRFEELYDGAKKQVVAGAKYTDTTIRDNPYQSVAIAAGVGLLVGIVMGRRGRSCSSS
jgi:ElaB/YqjD/DUF883 family membrane-anchored ribosome-binding protein